MKMNSLNFGKYRHCLYHTASANFIKEDRERFVLLEGKKCETGTMFFCNTYLEAIFVMKLEKGIGLYSDENGDAFVVCSKKSFK